MPVFSYILNDDHLSHTSVTKRSNRTWFCFVAELPRKWRCFNTQEFTRFLSNDVISASSHAFWRVLSNKVIWVLGRFWVDIPHIHTSEWDTLFFQSCSLSTVTVTPSDSDYVNRSASPPRFRSIYTSTIASTSSTGCMRTRQSPYKIVGDCSDEGGSLLCQGPRRWREETAWKRRRVKTSLVVVMFLLRVMTCVVFYINCFEIKLVMCDLYLTRFDLTKNLWFWHFFYCCC